MLKILHFKTSTLGKSAAILTFFTLSAQVLAIIRNKIFAVYFGAGQELDIYYASFKIPDMVFLFIGTLMSSFILMPFFENESQKSNKHLKVYLEKITFSFSILIIIVLVFVYFLVPFIAETFFSGFEMQALDKFIDITRILLISPFFMALSKLFIGINQKNGYFFASSITGFLYNISIIFGTVVLYPFFGFDGVVQGVVLGSFLSFLVQVPAVVKEKLFPKKISFFSFKEIFRIFKVAIPRSFALIITDFILFFLISQASLLSTGSVTILSFALSIFSVPINLIAATFSMAGFPQMVKYFKAKKMEQFEVFSRRIISQILFFGLPIMFFIILFSREIVDFLLGSEKFGFQDVNTTALIVSVFSIGIIFKALLLMIFRIFYAMEKTWSVFWSNILIFIIFFVILFFVKKISLPFELNSFSTKVFQDSLSGLFYLSFSYTCSVIFGLFLIIKIFKKNNINFSLFKNIDLFKKILVNFLAIFSAKASFIFSYFVLSIDNQLKIFDIILSILLFGFFWCLFSEIMKENDYINFKNRFLNFFKNKNKL